MNQKHSPSIYHVNVNLMKQNVSQVSQWWNNSKCRCECEKIHVCDKEYLWNPSTCICENGKYFASIMDDLAIICGDVINSYNEEIKTIPANFSETNITCKTRFLYFTYLYINFHCITGSC